MGCIVALAGTRPAFARRMSAYGPVLVNTDGKTSPKMENFSKNDKKVTKNYKKVTNFRQNTQIFGSIFVKNAEKTGKNWIFYQNFPKK